MLFSFLLLIAEVFSTKKLSSYTPTPEPTDKPFTIPVYLYIIICVAIIIIGSIVIALLFKYFCLQRFTNRGGYRQQEDF